MNDTADFHALVQRIHADLRAERLNAAVEERERSGDEAEIWTRRAKASANLDGWMIAVWTALVIVAFAGFMVIDLLN